MSSCAKKMNFQSSNIVPAAEGNVKIKKDNNNNYRVDVSVTNLAEPKKLSPPKDTYVVWIETSNGVTNAGRMGSSSGLFSSALKAKLTATSLSKPTRVFITAENDGNITFPGSEIVLSTGSF
jgi:hypothetical protein